MESNNISGPSDFQHMEGVSVDFNKTFDLNGTDNDEMLRLYLRKAGLSDEIECLSPEQRRAFIYDIIKSNKMPGYWMPSTMRGTMSPPGVRPPLRISGTSSTNSSPSLQRRNEPNPNTSNNSTIHYATMSISSSTNSLQSLGKDSAAVPQRFVPAPIPASPPSPSTFISTTKGSKYEISGPINFQHISGDMTRDMTRNAFDLSLSQNDNVLKKYMIERGITEEDISGMRKPDLIRAIVQSKFTWMPPKKKISSSNNSNAQTTSNPKIAYATISKNNQMTPPPSPPPPPPTVIATPVITAIPTRPAPPKEEARNFTLIASRFADPSQFPSPESIYGTTTNTNNQPEAEVVTIRLPPLPPQALRPAPPPRKSKTSFKKNHAPPPPPSAVKATVNSSNIYYAPVIAVATENLYETIPASSTKSYITSAASVTPAPPPPPPPPPPPMPTQIPPLVAVAKTQHTTLVPPPPPPPASASTMRSNIAAPVPPPPPPPQKLPLAVSPVKGEPVYNKTKVTLSAVAVTSPPPPPPPPPPMARNDGGAPIAPPPPPVSGPTTNNNSTVTKKPETSANAGVDQRDAFLESIRNGVNLKKVNQKAATLSGVKPQAERKPPARDFLSELKMGVTLRRVKNPEQNPFAGEDPNESHA